MNMCKYEYMDRCMAYFRPRGKCDPRCPIYNDVPLPENPSKDPPCWVARITSKAVALICHRKEKHHGQRHS